MLASVLDPHDAVLLLMLSSSMIPAVTWATIACDTSDPTNLDAEPQLDEITSLRERSNNCDGADLLAVDGSRAESKDFEQMQEP